MMLWSKTDTVYLDATSSIVKKAQGDSGCFYIYELTVKKNLRTCKFTSSKAAVAPVRPNRWFLFFLILCV